MRASASITASERLPWAQAPALAPFLAWAMGGFVGLSGKGVVALTLGLLFTAGFAIGLMALVFLSDRSGRDDETNRAAAR